MCLAWWACIYLLGLYLRTAEGSGAETVRCFSTTAYYAVFVPSSLLLWGVSYESCDASVRC